MKATINDTAIVIPAYNAEKYLKILIYRLLQVSLRENIILVNDGSSDNTMEIGRKLFLRVIDFPENRGKGAALLAGFAEAINSGFRFAISIDADLQHDPNEIPNFIKKQNESDGDMIIGKRNFRCGRMPFQRICSNKITSFMVSLVSNRKIYDSQSGYRLYNLNLIRKLKFSSARYQFESEIIIKYARLGGRFDFIPIATIYNGQESHISHFRDINNFIKIIFHSIFGRNGEQR
jgi:glycosyltransferase involved in cell wall biosynthesis